MTEIYSQKLKRFAASVNSEIEEQIEQIQQDSLTQKQELLNKTEDRVLNESYTRIQKSVRDIESKYRRIFALREQELNTETLKYRNELVKKIFEAVESKIIEFTQSEKYEGFLIKQLEKENVKDAVIKISDRDMKFRESLEKASGCTVEADSDIELGGIALFFEKKGIVIDKTFDNALEEHKQSFSSRYSFKKTDN